MEHLDQRSWFWGACFLLAAIEALAEDNEGIAEFEGIAVVPAQDQGVEQTWRTESLVTDAYCEYFRRQLAHVECVEDALAEMDLSR